MKIAVIGQSLFGQEVYKELRKDGHTVVGVFTIPDKDGKADPLGEQRHRNAASRTTRFKRPFSSVSQQPKQRRTASLFSNSPAGV